MDDDERAAIAWHVAETLRVLRRLRDRRGDVYAAEVGRRVGDLLAELTASPA